MDVSLECAVPGAAPAHAGGGAGVGSAPGGGLAGAAGGGVVGAGEGCDEKCMSVKICWNVAGWARGDVNEGV